LPPPKKNVDSEKSGLGRVVRRTGIKEAVCLSPTAYSSSEGDQVFLLPLELFPVFGDFFEVVLQATSAMFVTNYPRGYTKVGFCYSQTEKSACKSPQNSSMFETAAILWRQIAMKSPLVYKDDLESPQKSPV